MPDPTTREYKGLPLTIPQVIARYLRQIADGPECAAELQRLGFEEWRDSFWRSHLGLEDEGIKREWDSRDYTDDEMRTIFDGVIACASRTKAEGETWEDVDTVTERWVAERGVKNLVEWMAPDGPKVNESPSSAPHEPLTNTVERRSWEEFRETGLFWMINTILHLDGWAIVLVTDDADPEKVLDAYPVRTKWRGFPPENNERGVKLVTEWRASAGPSLRRDIADEPEPPAPVVDKPVEWKPGMDAWDPSNEHCVVVEVHAEHPGPKMLGTEPGPALTVRWDDGVERTMRASAFAPEPDKR